MTRVPLRKSDEDNFRKIKIFEISFRGSLCQTPEKFC